VTLLCQWCGAQNPDERELCLRCGAKLLVVSGGQGGFGEQGEDDEDAVLEREGLAFDEHLLERLSSAEESVRHIQGTLKRLEDRTAEMERSLALLDAGVQAIVELLDRRKVVRETEVLTAWERAATSDMSRGEALDKLRSRRDAVVSRARATGGAAAATAVSRALHAAELSLLAGQSGRAVEALSEALRRGPRNPELATLQGELAYERDDLEAAERSFRQALEWDPANVELRVYLGTIQADTGRDGEARETLEAAVAQTPESFLPRFALGALHAAAGRRNEARKALSGALSRERVPQALFLLGLVELDSGRPGAAAKAFEQALKLDAEFEDAIYYLGLAYLERNWPRRALECFRRVLEMDPQRLHYQEAVRLIEGGGAPAIPAELEGVLKEASEATQADEVERVLKHLTRVSRSAEHPSVLASLALLAAAAGRGRQALAAAHRLLRSEVEGPPQLAAWMAVLEVLRASRRHDSAARWGERLLREGRGALERAIAAYELALNELDRGGAEERALEFAHTSLQLIPSELRHYPLAALGRIHLAREEYSDAVDYLEQAAQLSEAPVVLTQLGLALLGAGQGERAREVLQRARSGAARDLTNDVLSHLVRVGQLAGHGRRRS